MKNTSRSATYAKPPLKRTTNSKNIETQVGILWKEYYIKSLGFFFFREKLTQKIAENVCKNSIFEWLKLQFFKKKSFGTWQIGQPKFGHHSGIEVLQNCSATLCVSFSRERKSERIERIFFLKIPTTVHREKKKTIHSCPHCDKQFEIKKTMTYHMFNVHGDEKVAHFRLVLFLSPKIMRHFQVTYSLHLLLFWSGFRVKDGQSVVGF